jgi:hypothetical protein
LIETNDQFKILKEMEALRVKEENFFGANENVENELSDVEDTKASPASDSAVLNTASPVSGRSRDEIEKIAEERKMEKDLTMIVGCSDNAENGAQFMSSNSEAPHEIGETRSFGRDAERMVSGENAIPCATAGPDPIASSSTPGDLVETPAAEPAMVSKGASESDFPTTHHHAAVYIGAQVDVASETSVSWSSDEIENGFAANVDCMRTSTSEGFYAETTVKEALDIQVAIDEDEDKISEMKKSDVLKAEFGVFSVDTEGAVAPSADPGDVNDCKLAYDRLETAPAKEMVVDGNLDESLDGVVVF